MSLGISDGSSGNTSATLLGRIIEFLFCPCSLEEDFITWREQFWPAVCEHLGVEATGEESRWVWEQVLLSAGEIDPSDWQLCHHPELLSPPWTLPPLPGWRGRMWSRAVSGAVQ